MFAMRMGWQIHPSGAHGGGMPTDRRWVGAVAACTCLREECESTCEMASGPAPSRSPADGNEVVNPPACFGEREGASCPPPARLMDSAGASPRRFLLCRAAGGSIPPAARAVGFPWAVGVGEQISLCFGRERDPAAPTPRAPAAAAGGFPIGRRKHNTGHLGGSQPTSRDGTESPRHDYPSRRTGLLAFEFARHPADRASISIIV